MTLPSAWACLLLAALILAMPSFAQAEAASQTPVTLIETVEPAPELRGTYGVEEPGHTSAALYSEQTGASGYSGVQIATFTLREIAVSVILLVLGGLVTLLGLSFLDDRNGEFRR